LKGRKGFKEGAFLNFGDPKGFPEPSLGIRIYPFWIGRGSLRVNTLWLDLAIEGPNS